MERCPKTSFLKRREYITDFTALFVYVSNDKPIHHKTLFPISTDGEGVDS
jgi:hypothetical protein